MYALTRDTQIAFLILSLQFCYEHYPTERDNIRSYRV